MKAAVYYETGAPDVFRYEDVPDPVAGPGDILIDVEAVSIEGGDTLNRLGGDLARVPHIVGYQAAGTVAEVGAGSGVRGGGPRRDGGLDGSHAARRAAGRLRLEDPRRRHDRRRRLRAGAVRHGRRLPVRVRPVASGGDGADPRRRRRRRHRGDPDGQAGRRAGPRTASSDDRLERLKELGLDEGINYVTHDFVAEARRLTDGRGVDVVVDSVGGTTLQGSINVLAYRGRCVTVGDAGRAPAESVDISNMRPNNQSLSGYFLGAELLLAPRAPTP